MSAESACVQTGGDGLNLKGKCTCKSSRGLKRSDDEKTCVCEKSGYKYDKTLVKCVAPDRTDVLEFMDELTANSKERFL